jgi:hypothetical protein
MKSLQLTSFNASVCGLHARISMVCTALLLGLLASCSEEAPPVSSGNLRPAVPTARDMVAQVRAAGVSTASELEVTPLRDPQVEDLRDRAAKREAQSDYPGASQAIAQALALEPGDPDLLQQAAEFSLYQQDWTHAESFAQQSYDRGPKLGSLCRRNWTTLRFVRLARGDAIGVQAAIQQVTACAVEPPVRM